MEALKCTPYTLLSSSMLENKTLPISNKLWLLIKASSSNHLFNQFMLWCPTKHGVNISGQMVSPFSEYYHGTMWKLPLEHVVPLWFPSIPCVLSFLSPSLLLHIVASWYWVLVLYTPMLNKVLFNLSLLVLIINGHFICKGSACGVGGRGERNIMLSSWVGMDSIKILRMYAYLYFSLNKGKRRRARQKRCGIQEQGLKTMTQI